MMPDLVVDRLTVRFGGLVAVDDVSLVARPGTITGLIGPNGAGKTTLFNACAGAVSVQAGYVRLGNDRLDGHLAATRASMGLGRTFQRIELFDSMTVAQNVALGPEAWFSARRPWGQLFGSRAERTEIARRAEEAIGECGIFHLRQRTVGDLSTGQRRLVELARAFATPFRFLLLDEPSSGLDVSETAGFGEILSGFMARTGMGTLLVEHDMALVSQVCSYIYVLDFGRLIFSASTAEALSSDVVKAAYLGIDEDLTYLSGSTVPGASGRGSRGPIVSWQDRTTELGMPSDA
jgi:ABC-type branched-subunit amino acid transport system ATPase component